MKTSGKLSLWVQYANLIKITIAIVITLVSTSWAVFRWIDKNVDKINETSEAQIEKEHRDSLFQRTVLDSLSNISQRQIEQSEELKLIRGEVYGVKDAVNYHIKTSNDISKEDAIIMKQLMEELKKNVSLENKTALTSPDGSTR